VLTPNQIRWRPFAVPSSDDPPCDFVRGLQTICGAGSPLARSGYAIHVYAANASMTKSCLGNADGDMLIVPQLGVLRVKTEMGRMVVSPGEIAVIPAGIRFSVALKGEERGGGSRGEGGSGGEERNEKKKELPKGARGYVLEVFGTHFVLPELGPIGANGLAAPRDFLTPKAWYEDDDDDEDEGEEGEEKDEEANGGEKNAKRPRKETRSSSSSSSSFTVVHKFGGELFSARQAFSPFNVVVSAAAFFMVFRVFGEMSFKERTKKRGGGKNFLSFSLSLFLTPRISPQLPPRPGTVTTPPTSTTSPSSAR